MTESAARALINKAKDQGYGDTWFLSVATADLRPRQSPTDDLPAVKAVGLKLTESETNYKDEPPPSVAAVAENLGPMPRLPLADSSKGTILRVEDANVKIDGRVEEEVWKEIPSVDGMTVVDPDTLVEAPYATNRRIFYDDRGLYVSAEMFQPKDTLVERLSSRDVRLNRDDFGFGIDASGEALYGYVFNVALGGSKMDGKITPERNVTFNWDGPWVGETAVTDYGWSAEMFIPWSALAMPDTPDVRKMGVSFWRKIAHLDQQLSTPPLPRSKPRFISGFAPVELEGIDLKQQWEIYPYVSATADEISNETEGRPGMDLAWRPSSNLQVTASLNPDFGSVESDDVVVNLTAYETFYPEKRLFFLEGSEVFVTSPRSNPWGPGGMPGSGGRKAAGMFKPEPTTLFNSRRIGGTAKHVEIPDEITVTGVEQGKPTELLGAVKVVGQSGGLRYGVLSAFEDEAELMGTNDQTGDPVSLRADGRDFGIARLLYEDSSGEGRRSIGYMGTLADYETEQATVHGIDTHWLSKTGKIAMDTQFMASDVENEKGYGLFSNMMIVPKQGRMHAIEIDLMDDQLDISDLGFLKRNDLVGVKYRFMKQKSTGLPDRLRTRMIGTYAQTHFNTEGYLTESFFGFMINTVTRENLELGFNVNYKPRRHDDFNSRGNGQYQIDQGYFTLFTIGTNSADKLSFSGSLMSRTEDLGDLSYQGTLGFTYTPVDKFSMDFDMIYVKRDEWLLYRGDKEFVTYDATEIKPSLTMDFFISSKQQIKLKFQWVGINADESNAFLISNPRGLSPLIRTSVDDLDDFTVSRLTAQIRYRWEIGPLSDLFLVYTRGSNLPTRNEQGFAPLFQDAVDEPIIDVFTAKLRYRFGS